MHGQEADNMQYETFMQRISIGFIQIVLFNYKNVCQVSFLFMHCVNINRTNVLFIAGDHKCYSNWQIVNFVFIVTWVLPFPIAMTTAYYLHKKKFISTSNFLICLMLPVLVPFFMFVAWSCCKSYRNDNSVENYTREKLFEIFEQPYRINYFWWESYRLYEMFLVAGIVTLYIDSVQRVAILSPLFIMLWLTHYHVKPFRESSKMLRKLDLLSNTFLCLQLIISMFRANVYTHNLPHQFPVDDVSKLTKYLDEIFSPWWWLVLIYLATRKTKTHKIS